MSIPVHQTVEAIQKELWELLACGQSLAESQHWFAGGEQLVLYQQPPERSKAANKEDRMIEALLNPTLLSTATHSDDSKYFAAGSLILDNADQHSGRSKQKVTALLAMNDFENFIEPQAASYWMEVISRVEKSIVSSREKGSWDTSAKETLVFNCTRVLLEHCQPKIRFIIKQNKNICKAVWHHLRRFLDESGKQPIDAKLCSEVEKLFSMFESENENDWDTESCCILADVIISNYKGELKYVDGVFQSLYHDLRNLRSRRKQVTLSPERLGAVERLEKVLMGEYKTTYAEQQSLSSLKASEALDLTADDATTPFAPLRLIWKLGQYPLAIQRMVNTFSKYHSGYTFNIEPVSGPWFTAVTYSVGSLNLPPDADAAVSSFRGFLTNRVFFFDGEATLIEALAPKYYEKLATQRVLYVHGEVKLACILLAKGIVPVGSKISGTKRCCYTCDTFLKLLQKHFNFNIFVTSGTHSKLDCQWLFPDMALIWKHLDDDEAAGGFYTNTKLGLSVRQEKERRKDINQKMQALAIDLRAKITGKVKEIAGVVLQSRSTDLDESQLSEGSEDDERKDAGYFERYHARKKDENKFLGLH